jgi:hypothetical protein
MAELLAKLDASMLLPPEDQDANVDGLTDEVIFIPTHPSLCILFVWMDIRGRSVWISQGGCLCTRTPPCKIPHAHLRNVSLELRNVSLELRNLSLELRNLSCVCRLTIPVPSNYPLTTL